MDVEKRHRYGGLVSETPQQLKAAVAPGNMTFSNKRHEKKKNVKVENQMIQGLMGGGEARLQILKSWERRSADPSSPLWFLVSQFACSQSAGSWDVFCPNSSVPPVTGSGAPAGWGSWVSPRWFGGCTQAASSASPVPAQCLAWRWPRSGSSPSPPGETNTFQISGTGNPGPKEPLLLQAGCLEQTRSFHQKLLVLEVKNHKVECTPGHFRFPHWKHV